MKHPTTQHGLAFWGSVAGVTVRLVQSFLGTSMSAAAFLIVLWSPAFINASWAQRDDPSTHVEIHPMRQKAGISSGLVIAYGHLLPQPYLIEYQNEKLFVNSVQVKPPLTVSNPASTTNVVDPDLRAIAIITSQLADRVQDLARGGADKEKILEFARKQDKILSAEMKRQGVLTVVIGVNKSVLSHEIWLPKSGTVRRDSSVDVARAKKAQAAEVQWMQRLLKRGNCLIFLSNGASSERVLRTDFLERINAVMNENGSSDRQKVDRLTKEVFDGDLDPARDIVANYSKKEWLGK